jgi:hypothetical protein
MLPGTIDGMKHVCYFRHALALDERRAKFLPEYAYGGSATHPTQREDKKASHISHESTHNDNSPSTGGEDDLIVVEAPSDERTLADDVAVVDRSQVRIKSTTITPHTIEVWFAGTHSDM